MKVLSALNTYARRRGANLAFDFGHWLRAPTEPTYDDRPYEDEKVVKASVSFPVYNEAEENRLTNEFYDAASDVLSDRFWVGSSYVSEGEDLPVSSKGET